MAKTVVTKRDVITKVLGLDGVLTDEEREVVQKMIGQLDNRSSKPTKAQIENVGIKNDILAVVADGKARTAKEIADEVGRSTAKVASLLAQAVKDGKVEKIAPAKTKDAPTYVGVADATPYEGVADAE